MIHWIKSIVFDRELAGYTTIEIRTGAAEVLRQG